jgi:hypothetical protein
MIKLFNGLKIKGFTMKTPQTQTTMKNIVKNVVKQNIKDFNEIEKALVKEIGNQPIDYVFAPMFPEGVKAGVKVFEMLMLEHEQQEGLLVKDFLVEEINNKILVYLMYLGK